MSFELIARELARRGYQLSERSTQKRLPAWYLGTVGSTVVYETRITSTDDSTPDDAHEVHEEFVSSSAQFTFVNPADDCH